jgi:hypothetical protein
MLLLCVDWQAIVAQRGEMLLLCVERQVKVGKNRTTRTDQEEPNPVLGANSNIKYSLKGNLELLVTHGNT